MDPGYPGVAYVLPNGRTLNISSRDGWKREGFHMGSLAIPYIDIIFTHQSHIKRVLKFFLVVRYQLDQGLIYYRFPFVLGLNINLSSYIPGPPTILVWCTYETRVGGIWPRDLHQQRARRAHDWTLLRLWPMDWQPHRNWRGPGRGEAFFDTLAFSSSLP